jgi:hypothetical protein
MSPTWLIDIGGNLIDVILLIMGIPVFALLMYTRREMLANKKKHDDDLSKLRYSLGQTDKLAYGIGIAIQKEGKIKLFKQSANGAGDHALNRDV